VSTDCSGIETDYLQKYIMDRFAFQRGYAHLYLYFINDAKKMHWTMMKKKFRFVWLLWIVCAVIYRLSNWQYFLGKVHTYQFQIFTTSKFAFFAHISLAYMIFFPRICDKTVLSVLVLRHEKATSNIQFYSRIAYEKSRRQQLQLMVSSFLFCLNRILSYRLFQKLS
jgi:hypothetical protein